MNKAPVRLGRKTWQDGPPVATDLVKHITERRSIANLDRFLQPHWPDDLHDPRQLPDTKKAAERVIKAIKNHETIGIVGDYDMDGTPGAVLLHDALTTLGATPHVILPTRSDGYGFTPEFVARLVKQNVSLILTVDCGIRDFAAVDAANKAQCDVIILDHHECDTTLPKAFAIVNPKRPDNKYPFAELCGTAVAYKFLEVIQSLGVKQGVQFDPAWLAWQLDLVAMATLGDMVPLIDENRVFAHYGLKVIQRGARPGLRRLCQALGLDSAHLSYNDITFKLIPKLNASGRMESMEDVFTLLSSRDTREIDAVVKRVLTRDAQRQLLGTTMYNQAKARVLDGDSSSVIVLFDAEWHPGLTGLVASRLSEEYQRPVGILGTLDGQTYRGSMRGEGVSLPELISQNKKLVERFGGHQQAAGITVMKDNLTHFKAALEGASLAPSSTTQLTTDGTITLGYATLDQIAALEALQPWGVDHSEPLWSLSQVHIADVRWLGEKGNHLKLNLGRAPQTLDAILFGAEAYRDCDFTQPIDVYGTLTVNEFRGVRRPQLMVKGLATS